MRRLDTSHGVDRDSAELRDLQRVIDDIESVINRYELHIGDLSAHELEEHLDEISEGLKGLAGFRGTLRAVVEEHEKLYDAVDEAVEQADQWGRELDDAEDQIVDLEDQVHDLEITVGELETKVTELTGES